ncbi:hypothetical protein KY346_04760 [Candidatus Woesearchaeota archaeon]|nr:hypothetical protein [Candidatus Woesearchaeota archaeon]
MSIYIVIKKGDEMNKKGVSPLIATILLILFSIALGAVVMSWGEAYIEEKAEFVRGIQETTAGCDATSLNIIFVAGEPQICSMENNVMEAFLENGPSTELFDIQATVVGSEDAATKDSLLSEPMMPSDARKIMFKHPDVGEIRQIKLTPVIMQGRTLVPCPSKAIVVENINPC